MTDFSRRVFLKQLGVLVSAAAAGRSVFAAPSSDVAETFDFLVVGDSLVWGQGLNEKDKFYYLVKNWLREEIFKGNRKINLQVKAHSGARIRLHDYEREALKNAGNDGAKFYYPEINVSFQSIKTQIDVARKSYRNPAAVNLIMVSGGVADITVAEILNPFRSNKLLREDITKYCYEAMSELLEYAAKTFPNALIAVLGYYPIITSHTPMKKIVNDILEIYNSPGWLKPLINTRLKRQFFRIYRKKMIIRSRVWHQGSTDELKRAVKKTNIRSGKQRAIFIESPFGEENGYGAKNTLLWKVGKEGRGADALYAERKIECRETLDRLRKKTQLKLRTRVCELASIGHPNVEGSKAFAEAIQNSLKQFLLIEKQAAEPKVSNL
jgi:lysophospholipase L1-like esterase